MRACLWCWRPVAWGVKFCSRECRMAHDMSGATTHEGQTGTPAQEDSGNGD